jgi:hypothetical protein
MQHHEDLLQALGFQLDLLRLATAPHTSRSEDGDLSEAEELERILAQVPAQIPARQMGIEYTVPNFLTAGGRSRARR